MSTTHPGRSALILLGWAWAFGGLACGADSGGGVSVSNEDAGTEDSAQQSADALPVDTAPDGSGGVSDTATTDTAAPEDTTPPMDSAAQGDLPGPETCGNGRIDPDEQCDGRLFGATCQDAGAFLGGELGCDDTCQFDTSECFGDSPVSVAGETLPSFLHFNREGTRLIYMEPDSEAPTSFSMYTLDLDKDEVTTIADEVSAIPGDPVLGGVYPVTLGPTGRWATFMKHADRDIRAGELFLWDMASAEPPTLLGDNAANRSWFSADGRWLAWRQYDGVGVDRGWRLQLRDATTGETTALSQDAQDPRFGTDSAYMTWFNIIGESFHNTGQLVRRDLSDGEETIVSGWASSWSHRFDVSADGRRVAYLDGVEGVSEATLRIFDWATMETTTVEESIVSELHFSPTGRYLSYSVGEDVTLATVKVWDTETDQRRTLGDQIERSGVSFDAAERFGAYLADYSRDDRAGTLVIYALDSGEEVATVEDVSGLTPWALDWLPGSRLLFYRGVMVPRYLGSAHVWSEGGEPEFLASDIGPGRVWSGPGGARVLFRQERRDGLFNLLVWSEDEPTRLREVVERMVDDGLAISPLHTFALALVEPTFDQRRTVEWDGREVELQWLTLIDLVNGSARTLSDGIPPFQVLSGVSTRDTDWTLFTTLNEDWAAFTNVELDGSVTVRKEPLR